MDTIVIWCDECLSTVTVRSKKEVWRALADGWTVKLRGEKNYYGRCAACNKKKQGGRSYRQPLQKIAASRHLNN